MTLILRILLLVFLSSAHFHAMAEDRVTDKEIKCLAKNIYYEAGSESEQGKVLVGIVTLNRWNENSSKNICQVVHQRDQIYRTIYSTRLITVVDKQGQKKLIPSRYEVVKPQIVCQFSWTCQRKREPNNKDERWISSLEIARKLLDGDYRELEEEFSDAKYFHNRMIRPVWCRGKLFLARVGNHVFYGEK
jgi:N-acetylmuramoyl-L-alanine amidase